ncbi:transglycosylase SLT domain-containing protein [Gymnodinialimonas ceratoperidinii]|uniref:Transglycosylase SLT domain-containing protein n=1 Tax=Gymnodinialimonas ceratoperidinii TaxID=2856823 RepID=A0A8F6TY11_9RHOB|nr:transglycosylase SLT domain-containing protein [Gymnodinialimonas ceratoperidinii]QXT39797.1 transglycosylase SLT domain-containing protein [Gymnodinialimonas ceratoperidinii]
MYRRTLLIGLTATLASCGSREFESPRNLDDACALADERPHYMRAMRRAERNWNVPVHVLMAIIHQESRFDGDIRPPFRYSLGVIPMGRQSSAIGYSQALDGTWDEYRDATGNRRADRTDIGDATDFMGWYMNLTLERNNIPLNDTRRQYLAYHEGHTGYARASYNSKPWLLEVARRVESRAERYRQQLERC